MCTFLCDGLAAVVVSGRADGWAKVTVEVTLAERNSGLTWVQVGETWHLMRRGKCIASLERNVEPEMNWDGWLSNIDHEQEMAGMRLIF